MLGTAATGGKLEISYANPVFDLLDSYGTTAFRMEK